MSDFSEQAQHAHGELLKRLQMLRVRAARANETIRSTVEILREIKVETTLELHIDDLIEDIQMFGKVTPSQDVEGGHIPARSSPLRASFDVKDIFMGVPKIDASRSIVRFQALGKEASHEPDPAA